MEGLVPTNFEGSKAQCLQGSIQLCQHLHNSDDGRVSSQEENVDSRIQYTLQHVPNILNIKLRNIYYILCRIDSIMRLYRGFGAILTQCE